MACPWANVETVKNPVNFLDVMSEEIAKNIQKRDLEQAVDSIVPKEDTYNEEIHKSNDTDSDEVIAHIMQSQFNKEYDLMLKRTEQKYNRDSKVNISYCKYRTCPYDEQEEPNLDTGEKNNNDVDRFVSIEKEYASIPRCGYKKSSEGSQIVTKHDMLMSSRINACKVLQFPPGIHTGDTAGFDMKLNNKVYNSLRAHSHAQCSRDKAKTRPRTK